MKSYEQHQVLVQKSVGANWISLVPDKFEVIPGGAING